jgi:hypothetical protein
MPGLSFSLGLILAIAIGLVLLILIAVAPESVANVLGQLIQLVGRLVGALAEEAEAGAITLFNVVRSVFAPSRRVTRPAGGAQPAQSQAAQPQQPAGAGSGGQPEAGAAGTAGTSQGANQTPQAPGGANQPQGSAAASPAASTSDASNASNAPTGARGASAGTSQGAQQARGQTAQPQESTVEETPLMWVAETIFIRLLYLATVIVIAAADFVFAILRLQAVLFPTLPVPHAGIFSSLSLLVGALFVAIILLTGALTLDFLNVLPPSARLFPNLDDRLRRLLLFISVLSFVLSIFVVGALFFAGQLLTSFAQTPPLGAVIIATLLGVLQVLVVFLGAWGAVRGLAMILALVGGLVGIVLHLIALVLRWVAEAFYVLGTSIVPDLVFAIAAIFGHRRERPPRGSPDSNVLSIVGIGDRSSPFTALLAEDVVHMYAQSGLLAAGVYTEEPSIRDEVRARLARAGVNNISPTSSFDTTPLVTLKSNLIRAYQSKGTSNKELLWIVDGERVAQCTGTLASLKSEMPDLSITVLSFIPLGGVRDIEPYRQLRRLATQKLSRGESAVSTTILVDRRSPLYRAVGEADADKVIAQSLSGMLLAPLHNPTNPSFVTVARGLNEGGFAFAAIAADSAGLVAGSPRGGRSSRRGSGGGGAASVQSVQARAEELAKKLLTGTSGATVDQKPDTTHPSVYVNFVVPLSARSPEFAQFKGMISNWLADEHEVYQYGVVEGDGVDLAQSRPESGGDRFVQVGILYGIAGVEPQQQISSPRASLVEAEGTQPQSLPQPQGQQAPRT